MMQAIAKLSAAPDDLALVQLPVPEIGENEILVHIRAVGVGIHDGYFLPADVQYPFTIGIEGAGTVEKVGGKVTRFLVGEAIAFVSAMQPKGGTWAEFAVVSESSLIVKIPAGMSFQEAAAVPVAGNTVLKAFHALALTPGLSLFIAGASGAIGTFAVQLGRLKDCVVAGSASQKNHAYLHTLGAVKTVDYHEADWAAQIKLWRPDGVDAALAIQPGTGFECLPLVRNGGRLVVVSGDPVVTERGITVEHIPHHIDIEQELTQLMQQIADQEIRLEIERTYLFEDGIDALKKTQTRRARGKLIITLP